MKLILGIFVTLLMTSSSWAWGNKCDSPATRCKDPDRARVLVAEGTTGYMLKSGEVCAITQKKKFIKTVADHRIESVKKCGDQTYYLLSFEVNYFESSYIYVNAKEVDLSCDE